MKFTAFLAFLAFFSTKMAAQFAPAAGQAGSTAISKDAAAIQAWATGCTLQRGWQQIDNQTLGLATFGNDTAALGAAGTRGIVSLGDGGSAVLTFRHPIRDDAGFDFAIFENAFEDRYLELAFVEVSTDGQRFVRFPATSLTQTTVQTDGFGYTNPSQINNLAGKYRVNYGTPFDLNELRDSVGIDIQNINFVKIIDVVGSLSALYATYDAFGHEINDPFPTPFPSSGFDLDAVAVLHQNNAVINTKNDNVDKIVNNYIDDAIVFPSLAQNGMSLQLEHSFNEGLNVTVFNNSGIIVEKRKIPANTTNLGSFSCEKGIYFFNFMGSKVFFTEKITFIN